MTHRENRKRENRDNVYSGNVYVWGCVSVREYVRIVCGNVRVYEIVFVSVYQCVNVCEFVGVYGSVCEYV